MIRLKVMKKLIFLILLVLISCADEQKREPTDRVMDDRDLEDFVGGVRLSGGGSTVASSAGGIPHSLALLLIRKKTGLHSCNGFMVSPTVLVTNSHCYLPSERRKSCDEDILVTVSTLSGEQQSFCKRILYQSIINNQFTRADYMVMELAEPIEMDYQHYAQVSRQGISPNSIVTIPSIEVLGAGETFVLTQFRETRCRYGSEQSTATLDGPVIRLEPLEEDEQSCYTQKGFSGSPVFNQQSQIVGISFAGPNRENGHEENYSLITNFRCLQSAMNYITVDPRPASCL